MAASRHRQTSFLASPSVTALVTVANLIIVPVGIAVVLVVLTMSRRQDSDIQLLGLRPAGWQLLVPVDIGSHGSRFCFPADRLYLYMMMWQARMLKLVALMLTSSLNSHRSLPESSNYAYF